MTASALAGYRSLLKPAFLTTGVCLLAFGLAHVAFITWVPTASQLSGQAQPPLALRLLVMFAAPVAFGIPFAIAAGLLGAAAWRIASPAMRGWRYGLASATALFPATALSLWHGPYGDASPPGVGVSLLLATTYALPATVGTLLGGFRTGACIGLAALPLVAPWSAFLLGTGVVGWVVPFVISLFGILFASSLVMARLAPPDEPFSREAHSPST